MKNFIIIILLAISFSGISAQQKYFIYFKDKGIASLQKINKNSSIYEEAKSILSEKCIERRKKNLGEEYIGYEDFPVSSKYVSQLKEAGINTIHELKWFNCVTAILNSSQTEFVLSLPFVEKIEKVKSFKSKDSFEPDKYLEKNIFNFPSVSTELNYGASYEQLQISEIPIVHNFGIKGEGVIIGILDSGFDWKNHPALHNSKVIGEYDFVFDDPKTANENGDVPKQDEHGTYVLSIIGGYAEGELIGASPESKFILAKTEDIRSETSLEEDNYAAALEWLEAKGVDITTSSLGYSEFDDESESYEYSDMDGKTTIITRAIEIAFKKGVVTISSAGNEGNNLWRYITAPADGFNVLAVGAIGKDSIIASFSSRGPSSDGRIKPELVANGVSVHGADKFTGGYFNASGTSASSPIVAGAAGLLLSVYPHLTNQQVRKIMIESGSQSANPDNDIGYGIVSARRAIAFPNLKCDLSGYSINKIFFDETLESGSVWMHYKSNSGNFDSLKMDSNNGLIYSSQLPQFANGDGIEIYFSYSDLPGNQKIDPLNSYYTFESGSMEISLNTENFEIVPKDFYLSQNYPNPFNSNTTFEYSTVTPKNIRITIYNILGQKVKEIFKGLSNPGINYVVWNGANEAGMSVGSGPYIYTLEMDGNLFAKKMIYMK
ncbi:MAG: S8 family serine peptidase [bacterium]